MHDLGLYGIITCTRLDASGGPLLPVLLQKRNDILKNECTSQGREHKGWPREDPKAEMSEQGVSNTSACPCSVRSPPQHISNVVQQERERVAVPAGN